jgi:hypothetical protein
VQGASDRFNRTVVKVSWHLKNAAACLRSFTESPSPALVLAWDESLRNSIYLFLWGQGRQRQVWHLITVGATVFGLFPLAALGGPLWEPASHPPAASLAAAAGAGPICRP